MVHFCLTGIRLLLVPSLLWFRVPISFDRLGKNKGDNKVNAKSNGTGIYCSCHGQELLCVIKPQESLEVQDHRHGVKHVAVLSPQEVLSRLAGTTGGQGIIDYVKLVVR